MSRRTIKPPRAIIEAAGGAIDIAAAVLLENMEKQEEVTACQVTDSGLVSKPEGVMLTPSLPAQTAGGARLEAFFKVFHGDDKVLIVISADPDAIASAVAVKRLLWRKVSQVTIASVNQVKRPDNLRLLESLKLKLESLSSVNTQNFSRLVIVDSQPDHSPQTTCLSFDVVIDHHPFSPVTQIEMPAYVDIRPEVGATATMMSGLLKTAKIKPNQKLATALFYAIKTDTQNFVRQGQIEDMKSFRWLYPFIHPDLLSHIERAPIARSSFKKVIGALSGAVFNGNNAYSFLSKADHADTLVIVADFLMKVSGVGRGIAAGICGQTLVIIFRSGGLRQDIGKFAKQAFDEFGSAGGHKNMARAEIPLANLDAKVKSSPAAINRFIQRRLSGEDKK